MIRPVSSLLLTLIFAITLPGCNDKSEDPEPGTQGNAVPTGKFAIHLHTYIDETEVDLYNITYTTLDGRAISVSLSQCYLSGFELIKADGTVLPVNTPNFLKVLDQYIYMLGDIPVGNYRSFRFKVGLAPSVNSLNPSESNDSIVLNKPEMWFASSPQPDGYVFFNLRGSIDTSQSLSGAMAQFGYKIGTNANYVQVNLPDRNFTIVENQLEYGHLVMDIAGIFSGIPLNQASNLSVESPSDNQTTPATWIVNNIPSIFRYEM
jgi:hypothetical protein